MELAELEAVVGEVISTVALAGQISRELIASDLGVDIEIEFKDDANDATGQMLFLQLKSGDSYLRERKSDGDGFSLPRIAGDPEFRGRSPLDGSARLAEARERQRQEAGETDRLRGRAVRRDERAAVAGAGSEWNWGMNCGRVPNGI